MENEEGENPVVEHGMPLPIVEGFGLGAGTISNGLTPVLPISGEPPPPSKVVLEPDIPDDGLPVTKHVVPFPVIPIVPAGTPLSPGDASSVAPMGIPVGGTGKPGAMPSGEVALIPGVGLPIPPTCANAGLQPKSAACIAAINTPRIMISIVRTIRPARQ